VADWAALRDAYGSAVEVPKLLARVAAGDDPDAWYDLWSCLCHQGTVYSASFAALPELLAIAERASSAERVQPLQLAGAIVASKDVQGSRADFARDLPKLLPCFDEIASNTLLSKPALSELEFLYVLQAALAFREVVPWNTMLDRLPDGELDGECGRCGAVIVVRLDDSGASVGSEESSEDPTNRLAPADPGRLSSMSRWMLETARSAGHLVLASRLLQLFATGPCPACGRIGCVEEWVAAEVASWRRPE
jgi:hypothetical protein